MGETTKIQWCDHTFNPWMGCARVSPGCDHCYAATMGRRFGVRWGNSADRRFMGEEYWHTPLAWNRKAERDGVRRRVFCGSMCDVFEDRRELDPVRGMLWELIGKTPHLDWLLLTKRPENFDRLLFKGEQHNVWLGVTAENQGRADKRIPLLLAAPAMVRFVSCEPLLGEVDLWDWLHPDYGPPCGGCGNCNCCAHGEYSYSPEVDWVIVGGESGPGARACDVAWIRSLVSQCDSAAVPVFVKQLGGYPNKRANPDEWPPDLRVREWPEAKP